VPCELLDVPGQEPLAAAVDAGLDQDGQRRLAEDGAVGEHSVRAPLGDEDAAAESPEPAASQAVQFRVGERTQLGEG
jgi:hypothetical protein